MTHGGGGGGVKTRTVLVLDCSDQCGETLSNEVSCKLKSGTKFSAYKSILTACVEGLSEYCRIIYDLFPDSHQVSVVASGDKPFLLNDWNFSEQSILREFAFVRPEPITNLADTLDIAAQALTEPSSPSIHVSSQCKFRVVLLLQNQPNFSGYEYQDGANVIDVAETLNYHISRWSKGGANSQSSVYVPHCELLILRLTQPSSGASSPPPVIIPPPPKSTGRVLANLQFLQPNLLFDAFSDLAQRHHAVGRMRVVGIPMREALPQAERTLHESVLLYDASSQNVETIKGFNGLGTTKRKEIVVKWKSPDRHMNPDTLPCKSTHRITPQIVSSNSSVCLMKHVSSGHPVFFATQGSDAVSHALLLQGPEVILHMLHASTPTEGLPLQIYSTSVDNYRVKEFVEIVDSIILQQRPKSMKQLPPMERVQLNTKSNVSWVGTVNTINANPTTPHPSSSTIPTTPTTTAIATSTSTTISTSSSILPTTDPLTISTNLPNPEAGIGSSTNIPINSSTTISNITGPSSGSSSVPNLPSDLEPGKIVTVLAPKNLERYTRYFPWTEGDSLLYNSNEQCEDLRRLLDPFKRNMLKEYLNEEYVDTITELINRMFQFANANELRLFPNLGKSAAVRKEAYKKLWSDCHNFAQVCSSTPNHAKMVTLMERLWPEACGIVVPTPSTPTPVTPSSATPVPSTPLASSQPLQQPLSQSQSQPQPIEGQRRPSYQEIAFVPQSMKKEKVEPDADGDMWSQLAQSKKNLEEAELQAERERQMNATMPEEFRNKKRKQSNAEPSVKITKSEIIDSSSLFAKYWAAHTSKHTLATEFDGQLEGDQFQLYADLNK